jgi:hypothetical protein
MSITSRYFCIAHENFTWELPDFMTVVGTGSHVPPKGLSMMALRPDQALRNRYLGEYVALFEIRRMLIADKAEGFVGFCHYRRFALTHPIGRPREFNYIAHPDMLKQVPPEHYTGDGKTPIVPMSVKFPGTVLQQYAANAIGRDILLYFGDAIDCGVITSEEAANFLSGVEFIPAPTVAYIPVEWFVEIVHDLERVMSRYYRHHYIAREGYIERSMAFCCERLQAFLLAKRIAAWGADKVISRPLTVLSDLA